jgi:hypothetical protein
MSLPTVRVSYSLPEDVAGLLDDYCNATRRSGSDVVRQLLVEVATATREMPEPEPHPETARRTVVELSPGLRSELKGLRKADAHPTLSALIVALLRAYLPGRVRETVSMTVQVPTDLYNRLVHAGGEPSETLVTWASMATGVKQPEPVQESV